MRHSRIQIHARLDVIVLTESPLVHQALVPERIEATNLEVGWWQTGVPRLVVTWPVEWTPDVRVGDVIGLVCFSVHFHIRLVEHWRICILLSALIQICVLGLDYFWSQDEGNVEITSGEWWIYPLVSSLV